MGLAGPTIGRALRLLAGVSLWLVALAAGVGAEPAGKKPATAPAAGDDRPPAVSSEEVARLVEQLGDRSFAVRESAQKRLTEIASPEVARRLRGAQKDGDLEVRQRAERILQAIRERVAGAASRQIRRRLLWKHEIKGSPIWPVSAGPGLVCWRDAAGALHGLDARTGKKLWVRHGAAASGMVAGVRGPLTLVDGCLYVLWDSDYVAIDAATGRQRWRHQPKLTQPAGGSVRVNPGGPIVLGGAGGAVRLRIMAGQVMFLDSGAAGGGLSPPVVAGGVMYFTSPDGLHAVDIKTGSPRWKLAMKDLRPCRPVIAGKVVYFAQHLPTPEDEKPADDKRPAQRARRRKANVPQGLILHALKLPGDGG